MTTTTVLSDDTATIVQDDITRFEWPAVLAGAIIATAAIFLLVTVGAGLGLSLSSARNPTASGVRSFLTLGAIYFLAAQAMGAAIGGYVTGRMMRPLPETEDEHFRADVHGLAVWGLAVVFGLSLLALAAGPGLTAAATSRAAAPPANYWADKLLRPANASQASLAYRQYAQNAVPSGNDAMVQDPASAGMAPAMSMSGAPGIAPSYADIRAEASRLLTAQAVPATADAGDKAELARLVSMTNGMPASAATRRVDSVVGEMRAAAEKAADAARRAASYISVWTALALLFSAVVCVVATLAARWGGHDAFTARRTAD